MLRRSSFLIVLLMLLFATVPADALAHSPDVPEYALEVYSLPVPEYVLDDYLLDAGYPSDVVEKMLYGLKLDLYNNEAIFEAYHEAEPSALMGSNEAEIGAMSAYNFFPSYFISRVRADDYTQFRINFSWAWFETPTVCFTDKMAIAWDYNWNLVPETTTWEYHAYVNDQLVNFQSGRVGNSPGIYHVECDYDILYASNLQRADVHSGWIGVTVQAPTGVGAAQIAYLGKMFHRELNPGGSIDSSGAPSLSISWGWLTSPGEPQLHMFDW